MPVWPGKGLTGARDRAGPIEEVQVVVEDMADNGVAVSPRGEV